MISNDWVVRHHGRFLQLLPPRCCDGPRAWAQVYESMDGTREVRYRGERLDWEAIPARPAAEDTAIQVPYSRPRPKPGREHPYKRYAESEMKQRRRRLLAQAVAARAAGGAGAPPTGSAPAPSAANPSSPSKGDIPEKGTF